MTFIRLLRYPPRLWPTLSLSTGEGSVLFMGAFIISAAMGVVRQILFNARFGIGEEAAALYAAFRLSETVSTLIAGGVLTNALTPYVLLAARKGHTAVSLLISRMLSLMLVVALLVTLLLVITAPWLLRWIIAPGLDQATQELATLLTRILAIEIVLQITNGVLSAVLIARGQFFLPALGIALRNTLIIVSLLLPQATIITAAIGSLGDSVIQLLILIPGLIHHRLHLRLSRQWRDPLVQGTLQLVIPGAISSTINYGNAVVDTAIASLGAQAAGLGAMHNALLLGHLPQRLCGTAIGQAAFPHLAVAAITRNRHLFRQRWMAATGVAIGLATLSSLALALGGRWLIALLFERGAFDQTAGDLTFAILLIFVLGLPLYVMVEITGRALVALGDARTPLLANTAQLVSRIIVATVCWPLIGVLAVPVATVASSAIEAFILSGVLLNWLREPTTWRVSSITDQIESHVVLE
ncbi:MAG: virulence factor MviN [Chloroflexus sp.]|uniref:murein biosynthesis integral membrane protein MurJ n=1 Tax=Chloroflexus sp. TaxID=1904827 RepID=UPI0021DC4F33|nr:lipid II flippase MurJ [Chloroflexus sp.]GIV89589.1 MAG: virulence factor MviN [Chloroflexus sp.]